MIAGTPHLREQARSYIGALREAIAGMARSHMGVYTAPHFCMVSARNAARTLPTRRPAKALESCLDYGAIY